MEYPFLPIQFQSVCVFRPEVSLLWLALWLGRWKDDQVSKGEKEVQTLN